MKARMLGAALAVSGPLAAAVYVYLLSTDYWAAVVRATLAALALLAGAVLAWVGYSIATAPPPKPIEEIEREIEQEIQKLREEASRG